MEIKNQTIFETKRLRIRLVEMADADLLYALWKDPRVMTNVGFPGGLPMTREDVRKQIEKEVRRDSEYDHLLIAALKTSGEAIGECKLYLPDKDGNARTDVKLLPKFWGNKYGVEIKSGLVSYLFQHTDCDTVCADPNINNIASIKMQEAVGGVRIREESYEFPPKKRHYTVPIRCYVYQVTRQAWMERGARSINS